MQLAPLSGGDFLCMQALSGGDKSIRLASETEAQLNEIKQRAAANRSRAAPARPFPRLQQRRRPSQLHGGLSSPSMSRLLLAV